MDNSANYKTCEQCGQSKHISEFSKSYKKLCKACVAENTKEARKRTQNGQNCSQNTENRTEMPKKRTETVKARIKATGEIIDIASYARVTLSKCDSYGDPLELGFDEVEILTEKTDGIDWEQRRYEIAKEMLAAIYLDDGNAERADKSKLGFEFKSVQGSAREAVRMADGLIAELQKPRRYGQTEE